MNKAKDNDLRLVVFRDGDMFIAQCLEHDICVQAPDMKTLRNRYDATLEAEREHAEAMRKTLAECVGPAPDRFHKMWEEAWGSQDEQRLALCA